MQIGGMRFSLIRCGRLYYGTVAIINAVVIKLHHRLLGVVLFWTSFNYVSMAYTQRVSQKFVIVYETILHQVPQSLLTPIVNTNRSS